MEILCLCYVSSEVLRAFLTNSHVPIGCPSLAGLLLVSSVDPVKCFELTVYSSISVLGAISIVVLDCTVFVRCVDDGTTGPKRTVSRSCIIPNR